MDQLVSENGSLRKREQELVHAMCELERQLQQAKKVEAVESEQPPTQPTAPEKDTSEFETEIKMLKIENAELLKSLETKVRPRNFDLSGQRLAEVREKIGTHTLSRLVA